MADCFCHPVYQNMEIFFFNPIKIKLKVFRKCMLNMQNPQNHVELLSE